MRPKPASELIVPSPHNWRTTDEDEINRWRARPQTEDFRISNENPRHPRLTRLLGDGGLAEEARAALLEAVPTLALALAIENRLPEPGSPDQALLPPLSTCWKEALTPLRQFTGDPASAWKPVADCLEVV